MLFYLINAVRRTLNYVAKRTNVDFDAVLTAGISEEARHAVQFPVHIQLPPAPSLEHIPAYLYLPPSHYLPERFLPRPRPNLTFRKATFVATRRDIIAGPGGGTMADHLEISTTTALVLGCGAVLAMGLLL